MDVSPHNQYYDPLSLSMTFYFALIFTVYNFLFARRRSTRVRVDFFFTHTAVSVLRISRKSSDRVCFICISPHGCNNDWHDNATGIINIYRSICSYVVNLMGNRSNKSRNSEFCFCLRDRRFRKR